MNLSLIRSDINRLSKLLPRKLLPRYAVLAAIILVFSFSIALIAQLTSPKGARQPAQTIPVKTFSEALYRKTPPVVQVIPTVFAKLAMPEFAPQVQTEEVPENPSLPEYTLTAQELVNLSDIEEDSGIKFSQAQLQALESQGFFLAPTDPVAGDPEEIVDPDSRVDDMVDMARSFSGNYSMYFREPEDAVFISSELLLHIYHSFLDKTIQNIEETKWHPLLRKLSQGLYQDSLKRYQEADSESDKESLKRLTVYFLVPSILLETSLDKPGNTLGFDGQRELDTYLTEDPEADTPEKVRATLSTYQDQLPDEIYSLAQEELDLVLEAKGLNPSPLFASLKPDSREDYSQYQPRSHYNKNSALRSYFRAMMWYGRHGFDVSSLPLTRDAAQMTWALNSLEIDGEKAFDLWEAIYLPTVFYVGRSDDLTFYDYSKLMKAIYGDNISWQQLDSKLTEFQNQAKQLEGPKILSEAKLFPTMADVPGKAELLENTKGFRFMGQRFIPDSYMFSQLTQGDEPPDEETGQRLPSTPTALMIMSILGSQQADKLLDTWIQDNARESDKVIAKEKAKLVTEFSKVTPAEWTQNVYWSWLYTLKSLLRRFEAGFPMFMQHPVWEKKSLQTALGSWTELRHDTLLYAKQSYAEKGGGGGLPELPPVPKGYVEPNILFFNRLINLSTMTREGLASRGLLPEIQAERLDNFIESLYFLRSIAEKELENEEISDDYYEKLRVIAVGELSKVLYPIESWYQMREKDARSAIIADVHTDVPKGQILYEATGVPSVLYVAVKDKGGARLTRGQTYSYYEFAAPLQTRLSDEDWQGMVYDNKGPLPSPPSWTQDLVK